VSFDVEAIFEAFNVQIELSSGKWIGYAHSSSTALHWSRASSGQVVGYTCHDGNQSTADVIRKNQIASCTVFTIYLHKLTQYYHK